MDSCPSTASSRLASLAEFEVGTRARRACFEALPRRRFRRCEARALVRSRGPWLPRRAVFRGAGGSLGPASGRGPYRRLAARRLVARPVRSSTRHAVARELVSLARAPQAPLPPCAPEGRSLHR